MDDPFIKEQNTFFKDKQPFCFSSDHRVHVVSIISSYKGQPITSLRGDNHSTALCLLSDSTERERAFQSCFIITHHPQVMNVNKQNIRILYKAYFLTNYTINTIFYQQNLY